MSAPSTALISRRRIDRAGYLAAELEVVAQSVHRPLAALPAPPTRTSAPLLRPSPSSAHEDGRRCGSARMQADVSLTDTPPPFPLR
eukprot:3319304-Rhodomonas_salina.1